MAEKANGLAQELKRTLYLAAVILICWTLIVLFNLIWEVQHESDGALEMARIEARSTFNKDLGLRQWASSHGGVYVPANERTPPNPYLKHIPERDIFTPSGTKLTLMNPAYMLRQFMDEYSDSDGAKGKITSLKLLNPKNAPDTWESEALRAFAEGELERQELGLINGEEYLRLMQPLRVEEGCLKCHGHQGYKVGDLRGGVSAAVPLAPYLAVRQQVAQGLIISHGLLWALVVVAILLVTRQRQRRLRSFLLLQNTLAESEERLSRESQRLDEIIWGTNVGTWEREILGGELKLNERCAEIIGYSLAELQPVSLNTWRDLIHPDDLKIANVLLDKNFTRQLDYYECENRMRHKNGDWVWVLDRGKVVSWSEEGKPLRMVGTQTDISARKQAENALQASNERLSLFMESATDGFILFDSEFNHLEMNRTALELTGLEPENVIGKNVIDVVPGIEASGRLDEYRRVMETGEVFHIQDLAGHPFSGGRHIELKAFKVGDGLGISFSDITERVQFEAELVQQKSLLESIFRAAPDALVVTDTERKIVMGNPGLFRLFGFQAKEMLGRGARIFYESGDEYARQEELRFNLNAEEMLKPYIVNYRRKNGETFPGETVGTVIKDSEGEVLGYLGLMRDVSERLQAEQMEREREEVYRALFENNHSTMILLDPEDGEIIDANPAACSFYGYSRAELIEKKIVEINTLSESEVQGRINQAKENGQQFYFRHRLASGELRDVEVHSGPILIRGRKLLCSIIYDVTNRKLAEEALLMSESKHKHLAEVSPSGIWQTDAAGNGTYASPRWCEITGISADNAAGTGWTRTLHPEDKELLYREWIPKARAEGRFRAEYRYVRPEESIVWVLCIATPEMDGQGQITGWVGTITDITELKQQEASLRENQERLSASLLEKVVLLREIHHRVKNNLQIISSLLQLQARQGTPEIVSALGESERRVKVMAHLHEKLYQSGDLQHIDTPGFLCSLIDDIRASQTSPHLPVSITQEIEQIELNLDQAILVGQILSELLSNAIKHAFPDNKGGEIRISLRRTARGQVELSLADTGVGLPNDFDSRKAESLGWRLVNALASKLGARIEVKRSNGTCISLLFDGIDV